MRLKLVSDGEIRSVAGQPGPHVRLYLLDEQTNEIVTNLSVSAMTIERGEEVSVHSMGRETHRMQVSPRTITIECRFVGEMTFEVRNDLFRQPASPPAEEIHPRVVRIRKK